MKSHDATDKFVSKKPESNAFRNQPRDQGDKNCRLGIE
jgi:hypothetical protein